MRGTGEVKSKNGLTEEEGEESISVHHRRCESFRYGRNPFFDSR